MPQVRLTPVFAIGCSLVVVAWLDGNIWKRHAAAQEAAPRSESAVQVHQPAKRHANLAERATDPTQSPQTLRFKSELTPVSYRLADGTRPDTRVNIEFQPILRFTAWGVHNILRLAVPFQIAGDGGTGLDDVQVFDLVVFTLPVGRLGVGAVGNFSAREKDVSSHASGGPAIGFVGPVMSFLNLGVFSRNSFASGIALSNLQPIVALQLGHGWALSTGDMQIVFDWQATRFLALPVQVELSKVLAIATQPMRFAAGFEYNFKDLPGAGRLAFKINLEFLLPETP